MPAYLFGPDLLRAILSAKYKAVDYPEQASAGNSNNERRIERSKIQPSTECSQQGGVQNKLPDHFG